MLSGPVALPTFDSLIACSNYSSKMLGPDKPPLNEIGILVLLGSSYDSLMYLPHRFNMSLVSMMILPDSS